MFIVESLCKTLYNPRYVIVKAIEFLFFEEFWIVMFYDDQYYHDIPANLIPTKG